jgi:hypothetical protein
MTDWRDPKGEDYEADPRLRRLKVVAQLIDKPLFLILVAFAFAAAARGPSMLIDGYQPSGWFVLGLWISFSIMARMAVVWLLARFRAVAGLAR